MMRRVPLLALACAVSLPAATYYVTIAGLGGEPEYEQRFQMWAQEAERILKTAPDARLETLSRESATRAHIRAMLDRIAKSAAAQDTLVLMLIGHGTFDGVDYRFNVPGPDITAEDLAGSLDRIPAGRQLVVNMTSASGGSLDALRSGRRVVVSATKSGTEKNATIFARYWMEALREPGADADKNQVISAAEAFRYASRKTAQFYTAEKRLATEHAVLDGEQMATSLAVVRFGETAAYAADPAKRKLLERREAIEEHIDRLKLEKAAMPAAEYKKQLTALLLEMAAIQEELEK
jgi:hypothetical protein